MLTVSVLVASVALTGQADFDAHAREVRKSYRAKDYDEALSGIDKLRRYIEDEQNAHAAKTTPTPDLVPHAQLECFVQGLAWNAFKSGAAIGAEPRWRDGKATEEAFDVMFTPQHADAHTLHRLGAHREASLAMLKAMTRLGGIRTGYFGDDLPLRVFKHGRQETIVVWKIGLDSILNTIQYRSGEDRARFILDKWLLPKLDDVATFGESVKTKHVAVGFTYGANNLVNRGDGAKPEFLLVVVPVATARAYADAKITKAAVLAASTVYMKTMDTDSLAKMGL